MTTRDALLTAIVANPGDDLPRLVYADFLDESGDPNDAARAELIRTQIAAAQLSANDPQRATLEDRAESIWEARKLDWFEGINPDKLPYPNRGFITHWSCFSDDFAGDSPVPFDREPISSLTLSADHPREMGGAAGWPGLARIRKLDYWPGSTQDEYLVPFFSSPHLTGLRALYVMGNRRGPWAAMPETVRVLATSPQYAALRDLTFVHAEIGEVGATALAESTTLGGLTNLGLGSCNLGPDAASALARTTTLRSLTHVGLGHCDIGVDGARVVLDSSLLDGVSYLGLGGLARTAEDGEALARALAESTHLTRLESLNLDETAFTDRAATLLGRARWASLKRLVILPHDANHSGLPPSLPTMSASGVEALASADWASTVEDLSLSGHMFGDAGAEAIARNRCLGRLRRLTLMNTGLTAAGLQALVKAYSHQLTHLQLARNAFGDAGARVIAGATWPEMVPLPRGAEFEQRGLFLALCDITDVGAEALLGSAGITQNIADLFLGQSAVSDGLVTRLKANYPNAQVRF